MYRFLFFTLFLFSFEVFGAKRADITVKKILDLDIYEPYDTHLVHAGRVWEGKVKNEVDIEPCIEIFDTNGKFLHRVILNYSPTHLFPHGPDMVVVTGKRSTPQWTTFYTKIKIVNGSYKATTHQFITDYQIDQFVGDGKREIFALFGDRALLGNLTGGWSVINKEEVIGPHEMALLGSQLYVRNTHNIGASGFETLSKIDLQTGKVKIVSGDKYLQGMWNLHYHEKTGLLAYPEYLINQVTLFDPKTDLVVGSMAVEDPRSIASIGNCLAASSYDKRTVTFYDITKVSSTNPKLTTPVSVWDLAPIGPTFQKARNIGFDIKSGRLFARSTYICSGCQETMSSVIMAEEPSQKTLKACMGKLANYTETHKH